MKLKIIYTLFISFLLSLSLKADTVEDVIKKARSYVGAEATLNGVETLHYAGRIIDAEGNETGTIVLRFAKDSKQYLELTHSDGKKEITACNEYEGYIKAVDSNGTISGFQVLTFMQVKHLHLNTNENLSFFYGPKNKPGAETLLRETTMVDDKKANVVRFQYSDSFYYDRYFDVKTGKVLKTVSGSDGLDLVENESVEVAGIRFPKEIHTFDDGELLRKIVFDKIMVNSEMDDSLFNFPEDY